MLARHGNQTVLIYFLLLLLLHLTRLGTAQYAASQPGQQQQQSLSSSLPVIDGWATLKTTTQLIYSWNHTLQHLQQVHAHGPNDSDSSSNSTIRVPRRGTALAHIRTSVERTVAQARFGLVGSLRVSNPGPVGNILVDRLQIECLWGLSLALPCAANAASSSSRTLLAQEQTSVPAAALLIHPGETALCSVRGLSVPAQWGTNFRQSCRVVATTWRGNAVQSGHFMLDFGSPDVMSTKHDCVRLSNKCEVTGSTFYQSPGVGDQLQQGVLVCANRTMDSKVIVNDVYGVEGDMPDGCSGGTKLSCSSDMSTLPGAGAKDSTVHHSKPQAAAASANRNNRLSSSTLLLHIIPATCNLTAEQPSDILEAGELDESAGDDADSEQQQDAEADSPALKGSKGRPPPRLRKPKVSLHVDGTHIVSNYTWLLSSSVAPEALPVYANSTAAAQFTISALRVPVRPSEMPKYYVDGTITVENHNSAGIEVASINAVLPWGQTAVCKPADDAVYPVKVDASGSLTCTYRLQYELGLKPSSLRAQVIVVGSPEPLKSWPKKFNFNRANLAYSAGACARVKTSFASDANDVSVTYAGGEAPDFGAEGTEVCEDFAKWDFTVLVTPVNKVDGVAMVVANTIITPTTPGADPTSSLSRSSVTVLSVNVQPWPYNDSGPLLKAAGSWRRGGEVPVVSVQGADQFLFGEKNESVTIRVNI